MALKEKKEKTFIGRPNDFHPRALPETWLATARVKEQDLR